MDNDTISRQAAIDALIELSVQRDEWDSKEGFAQKRGIDAAICAIEDLPSEQPEQRWIPVTEGLPREFTRVIGYMAWKAMTAIEYQHGRWYSIDHLEPLPDEAVTHWMPLPQPPKEGDE